MQLNLYKIKFEATNLQKMRTERPFGFAFILASDPEVAKQRWITNTIAGYMLKHPILVEGQTVLRVGWAARWRSTLLIKGPFENGFVICNSACDDSDLNKGG